MLHNLMIDPKVLPVEDILENPQHGIKRLPQQDILIGISKNGIRMGLDQDCRVHHIMEGHLGYVHRYVFMGDIILHLDVLFGATERHSEAKSQRNFFEKKSFSAWFGGGF